MADYIEKSEIQKIKNEMLEASGIAIRALSLQIQSLEKLVNEHEQKIDVLSFMIKQLKTGGSITNVTRKR